MTTERVDLGESVTLYCGDCAKVMAEHIPDTSIDLTVTSPPYDNLRTYNGYTFDFEAIAAQLWRVTKPGGVVVWVVGDATINGSETLNSMRQAIHFQGLGFNVETMIYEVSGTGAKGSNDYYWQAFEFMFVLTKGKPKTSNRIADVKNKTIGLLRGGRYRSGGNGEKPHLTNEFGVRSNIWRYQVGFADNSDKTNHPAPFPEALARDHILSWSNPGDVVLDPMMGSGTTGKMAVVTERRFIGIDISAEYVELARERIEIAQLQPRLLSALEPQVAQPQQERML